jgi:predicted Zn-dependent protease
MVRALSRVPSEGAGFYRHPHRRPGVFARLTIVGALVVGSAGSGCMTVPVTGRTQLNMFTVEQDKELGAQAYAEELKKSKLKDSGPEAALVQRVVARLAQVADDPGFAWEAHVIDDPQTVNAWCMPGGKIAVYTGILPLTEDETGLAVVLGHEIAHAIARHGTERITTNNVADATLSVLANQYESVGQYQQAIAVATDLLVMRRWGRNHELEADRIGLIYMAKAGYDPRRAIDFWQRMGAQSAGQAPPEFLSTHPSDEHRISELKKQMGAALAEYQKAGGSP